MDYSLYTLQSKSELKDLADAVRVKTNTSDKLTLIQMSEKIASMDLVSEDKTFISYIEDSAPGDSYPAFNSLASATRIGPCAFLKYSFVHTLTIPTSIAAIDDYAFAVSNIHTITIPNSVKSIGTKAFGVCLVLRNIHLNTGDFPNGWSGSALYRCGSLLDEFNHPVLTLHLTLPLPSAAPPGDGRTGYQWTCDHLVAIGAPWGANNLYVEFSDGQKIMFKNGTLVG